MSTSKCKTPLVEPHVVLKRAAEVVSRGVYPFCECVVRPCDHSLDRADRTKATTPARAHVCLAAAAYKESFTRQTVTE
eukprot:6832671-Pyramimonas_sp.AAC.1